MLFKDLTTIPEECQLTESNLSLNTRKSISVTLGRYLQRSDISRLVSKGMQIEHCGENVIVRRYESADSKNEVVFTYFCGQRLCPVCAHRRSLKSFWQVSRVMDYCDKERIASKGAPWAYVLITLTMENCAPEDLWRSLDQYVTGVQRLIRTREWKAAIKGAWRTLEITYNAAADTFHPHIHILSAVNPSYFTDKTYISQKRLIELWRRSAQLPYDPSVDIRRLKEDTTGKAKAEVSKYIAKQSDFLFSTKESKATELLIYLDDALADRKQYIAYGIFRTAARVLHLSDEDGQLLDPTDGDAALLAQLRPEAQYVYQLLQYDYSDRTYKEVDPLLSYVQIELLPQSIRPHYMRFRGLQLSQLISQGYVQLSELGSYEQKLVSMFGEESNSCSINTEQNEQK